MTSLTGVVSGSVTRITWLRAGSVNISATSAAWLRIGPPRTNFNRLTGAIRNVIACPAAGPSTMIRS